MLEFINKCLENGVSVEFERDIYIPQQSIRITLTKHNYRMVRVFAQPEISYLTREEGIFKEVLLGYLDKFLDCDPDTMIRENMKPIIW